jgi:membrane peptidoglycan carboxypeptidase
VYGHLRDYIGSELSTKFNITEGNLATSGYKIHTTFDKDIQDQTQAIVTNSITSRIAPNGGNNSAAMVLDGSTGQIIAMVGSADFNNVAISGQVNVATAPRQPGSSYKPYVYASAFENNFNPGTVLIDSVTDFGNYIPRNFSRTTRGATTIRSSLQDSLNIPAVKATYLSQGGGNNPNGTAGINNVISFAEKAGTNHPFRETCTLSAAIGGCEVTMISHATGINTLLQNGNLRTAKPFLKIIDRNGVDIYPQNIDKYTDFDRAVDPLVARQLANVMSDYNARSAGTWGNGRRTLQLDGWDGEFSVAAKTGTTNDVKDVWTVGGSPLYTVTVWAGNTDAKPMNSKASSTITAALTWKEIMTLVHTNKQKVGFSKEGLRNFSIDPSTGLPGEGRNELLTDNQIRALQTAQENLNKPDYNPKANSILVNRTPIVSRKLKVSKIDRKLVPEVAEGQTSTIPEELIEEIECKEVVSEFPSNPNWFNPVQSIQQSLGDQACPTEIADSNLTTQQPQITTNIREGRPLPQQIIINVTTPIPNATITKITFSVGGEVVKTIENSGRLLIDLEEEGLTGEKDIIIQTEDNLGLKSELILENVDFDDIEESRSSSSRRSSSSSSATISSSSSSSSQSSTNQPEN